MNVLRLHVRPKGGAADPARSFEYCRKEGVLGLGWAVGLPADARPTWQEYLELATRRYGSDLSRVRYFHDNVHRGDLIWTRDTRGQYYLARVIGDWEYRESPEAERADIVNVIPCEIQEIPAADYVPGKVVACFRPTRTIQRISDPTAVRYSIQLWDSLRGGDEPPDRTGDLFSLIDDRATEDLVFIYLQFQDWIVLPSSRRKDTMSYEYVLIHRNSGDRAVVQVKTGGTPLRPAEWADRPEKVFLFQSQGRYEGSEVAGVTTLSPQHLMEFALSRRDFLPRTIALWLPQ